MIRTESSNSAHKVFKLARGTSRLLLGGRALSKMFEEDSEDRAADRRKLNSKLQPEHDIISEGLSPNFGSRTHSHAPEHDEDADGDMTPTHSIPTPSRKRNSNTRRHSHTRY